MFLKAFDSLPEEFKNDEVQAFYQKLENRKTSLFCKRAFDVVVSFIILIILLIPMGVIALAIKADSKGNVIFCQKRVTTFGREFKIYKFRTMVANAESLGAAVTTDGDARITKVGKFLRKYRFDEFPQLINILKGDMSFVGTRPEVPKYVSAYTPQMYATLLLPAGITSLASIRYKDEERLISASNDADKTYIEEILPEKMKYNLEYMESFSFWGDIKLMFMTFFAVITPKNEKTQKGMEI
ncbi:MAG: sugar transferase [Clostridia bacterium]|nr:sugar transferase [Clostridia bacterium]